MTFTMKLHSTDEHAVSAPYALVEMCLAEVAHEVHLFKGMKVAGICRDTNGNKVGEWKLTLPKPKRTTRP